VFSAFELPSQFQQTTSSENKIHTPFLSFEKSFITTHPTSRVKKTFVLGNQRGILESEEEN
jgi:hypothetical protein